MTAQERSPFTGVEEPAGADSFVVEKERGDREIVRAGDTSTAIRIHQDGRSARYGPPHARRMGLLFIPLIACSGWGLAPR